jgi:hypothetical protein
MEAEEILTELTGLGKKADLDRRNMKHMKTGTTEDVV